MAYRPPTINEYARPVQFETPLNGISLVGLADGRGLLLWVNANRVRYAILASPKAFLADNVVTAGDTVTALSGVGGIRAAAVFRAGSSLYFSVHRRDGSTGANEIYVADSDSNPSSWSLHGTVQSSSIGTGTSYGYGWNPECSGIPFVDGSNWTISAGRWNTNLGQFYRRAGVWESSDGGVTWTNVINAGYYNSGIYMDRQAGQVAKLPSTGELVTAAGTNASARSEREFFVGPSPWSINDNTYEGFLAPFHGEGSHVYAMSRSGGIYRSPADLLLPMSSWEAVGRFATSPTGISDKDTPSMRAVQVGDTWYHTWLDRIAVAPDRRGRMPLHRPRLHVPHRRLAQEFQAL